MSSNECGSGRFPCEITLWSRFISDALGRVFECPLVSISPRHQGENRILEKRVKYNWSEKFSGRYGIQRTCPKNPSKRRAKTDRFPGPAGTEKGEVYRILAYPGKLGNFLVRSLKILDLVNNM